MTMREDEIIGLYSDRSEQAIEETSKLYRGMCLKIAYNVLRDSGEAEECVNDVLLKAWGSIPPAPQSLSAYLTKLTRNTAVSMLRRRNADKRGGGGLPLILDELEGSIPAVDHTERISDDITIRNAIEGFLDSLSAEDRCVFMDRYFRFLEVAEIASSRSMGESKVKMKLSRMRKKLEKTLKKEGIEL